MGGVPPAHRLYLSLPLVRVRGAKDDADGLGGQRKDYGQVEEKIGGTGIFVLGFVQIGVNRPAGARGEAKIPLRGCLLEQYVFLFAPSPSASSLPSLVKGQRRKMMGCRGNPPQLRGRG